MKSCNDQNVTMLYLAIGINRSPYCLSWSKRNLIAYGGCNSVIIYNAPSESLTAGHVVACLNGHSGRVSCVRWLSDAEVISGSADRKAIVWHLQNLQWKVKSILCGHNGAITCIATLNNNNGCVVATAAADSTLKLWYRKTVSDEQFDCVQTISFGHGIALTAALAKLPAAGEGDYLLATAREDCKILLYAQIDRNQMQFQHVISLVGHENWIRDLSFCSNDNNDLLLASCDQNAYIRVWTIAPLKEDNANQEDNNEIKLKGNLFNIITESGTNRYIATLDSVLRNHEDVIYSVTWCPINEKAAGKPHQRLRFLSASMDKTMIIWEYDRSCRMWLDKVIVGTMGGNNLGYYSGTFSPDGRSIVAQGYDGGLHMWKDTGLEEEQWKPQVAATGHFAPVQDLRWEPVNGFFLVSVSLDQTTRIHAPWIRPLITTTWHEIARPQIHGYDMQCVSLINSEVIVSGAEEKVIRVFSSPTLFKSNLNRISQVELDSLSKSTDQISSTPVGASVPPLGLSNKAMFEDNECTRTVDEHAGGRFDMVPTAFTPMDLKEPPTELYLQQNTLWPESQKLYGHPYEVYCLAYNPRKQLLASACKARKVEHAAIIIWDTQIWRQACEPIPCHNLTVTQIAFSHSGEMMLAVSRDRTWSLFKLISSEAGVVFDLIAHAKSKTSMHSRIIWSCSWSHDDKYFATASRDKKVVLWCEQPSKNIWSTASPPLDLTDAVTAIDFAPKLSKNERYILSIGLECGSVLFYTWNNIDPYWHKCCTIPDIYCHSLTVKRISWRPLPDTNKEDGIQQLQVASCSSDHSVRIFNVAYECLD